MAGGYCMNYTVLIVDDEAMPRKVLKEHLPWESLKLFRHQTAWKQ